MSDQTTPPEPTTDMASAAGLSAGVKVAVAAVVAVVAFGAAYLVAGATESDPGPAPTAAEVADAAGGAAALPLLVPTSDGPFVHPDVLAAQSAGELTTSDVPAEGAGPAFTVEEGQPATADVVVEDPDLAELADATLAPDPPADAATTRVIWPGLPEVAEPLEAPVTDDIDGDPEVTVAPDGSPVIEGNPTTTTAVTDGDDPPVTVASASDEISIELPGLVDPCADEPSLPGCGPGVGGTIIPTGIELLAVSGVSGTPGERCADQVDGDARDRAVLMIVSNERGRFELTWEAPGTGSDPGTVDVTTPDSEQAIEDAGGDVHTCVVVDRVEDASQYWVTVQPISLDDDAPSLPWSGFVVLPDGDGRPPVNIVEAGPRLLEVYVPAQEAEAVEVWTIPRASGSSTTSCDDLDGLVAAGEATAAGVMWHPEQDRATLPGFGMWDPSFDSLRQHNVHLFGEAATDLCIIWYRDLDPTREVVERQSWSLLPPAHPDVELVATGFIDRAGREVRLHGGDYAGAIVDLEAVSGRNLCNTAVFVDDLATTGEEVLCRFEVTPDRAAVAVSVGPVSPPGLPDPAAYRAVLDLRSEPCWDGDGCVQTYAVAVPGPPDGDDRTIMSTLAFEARYGDSPIRGADWAITATGTFATPESEAADQPRLDLGATRVAADPSNPFRVLVSWQADRPVDAAGATGRSVTGTPCRTGASPDARTDSPNLVFEGDRGTIPMWVCPGTPYEFSVVLREGSTRYTWTSAPTGAEHELAWRGGLYRTSPVDILVSAQARTRDPVGLSATATAVPKESIPSPGSVSAPRRGATWDIRYTWLRIGDETRQPERATGRYECGDTGHHDLALAEPFRVEAGASVPVQLSTQMYRFSGCGLFGNVPSTAGGKKADWHSGIAVNVPVLDLLESDPGWRVQDWYWPTPNMWFKCAGHDWYQLSDARTDAEARQKVEAWRAWWDTSDAESADPDAGPTEVGGVVTEAGTFCNPPPEYQVMLDLQAELAVGSVAGGVETPAG